MSYGGITVINRSPSSLGFKPGTEESMAFIPLTTDKYKSMQGQFGQNYNRTHKHGHRSI